jgi:ParB family chromosome partitioning protein
MSKNRGLGRGLGALIPELEEEDFNPQAEVDINSIDPNPYQPRKDFSDEKLVELADSIKAHGIIQPLVVREVNGKYQLIAGERRLRAAKMVGLTTVPIIIREISEQSMMEIALVENLQREDLNPIEEAEAYKRLMGEFHLTQDDIAQKVGKSRPAIANTLRLLNLPLEVQVELASGTLTMGHARALLSLRTLDEQKQAWNQIQQQALSVREAEELIHRLNEAPIVSRETKRVNPKKMFSKDPNILEIEDQLQQNLGTKVIVKPIGVGGKIEIDYYSSDDFDRICEKLNSC